MEQEKPFREELVVGVKTAAMTSSFPGLEHHVCVEGWRGRCEVGRAARNRRSG